MRRRIVIVGSRSSKLALIQAESVASRIRETNSDVEVSIKQVLTEGDRKRYVPLEHLDGIGFFVKELEEALLDGRIDLAVHSLKDMPTQVSSGLCLLAVTERLDPRDILVSRGKNLAELASGARIGTGSPRRAVQLNACRPDLAAVSIRGNVDTRMRKVASGECDGVILAAAALKRLGWEKRISEYLSTEQFLPAVGQGVLAIEVRSGDTGIEKIVLPLNDLRTWQSITAERTFLDALGGGCRAPIAALGTVNGVTLRLQGMVADVKQAKILHSSAKGSNTLPEELGLRLAQKLLDMGGGELLAEVRR